MNFITLVIILLIIFVLSLLVLVLFLKNKQSSSSTCKSYVDEKKCSLDNCGPFINKDNCGSFINKDNCGSFINKDNCKLVSPPADAKTCDPFITKDSCKLVSPPADANTCVPFFPSQTDVINSLTDYQLIGLNTSKIINAMIWYLNNLIQKYRVDNKISDSDYNKAVTDGNSVNSSATYKSDYNRLRQILIKLMSNNSSLSYNYFINNFNTTFENKNVFDIIFNLTNGVNIISYFNSWAWYQFWFDMASFYNDTLKLNMNTYYDQLGKKVPPFNTIRLERTGVNADGIVQFQWYIGVYPTCIPYTSDPNKKCTDITASQKYAIFSDEQSKNLVCDPYPSYLSRMNDIFIAYQSISYIHPSCPTNSIYRNNSSIYNNLTDKKDSPGPANDVKQNSGINISSYPPSQRKLFAERACEMTPNCVGYVTNQAYSSFWTKSNLDTQVDNVNYRIFRK